MKKEKKDESFIKTPYYEGGEKALSDFILKNLKYPKEALEKNVKGIVLIRCDIDYKGKVILTQVMKGIGHGCDEEAQRIAKLLEFKVPKSPRGVKVTFHKDLRIPFQFKIEKPKPTAAPQTYNYNIVPAKSTNNKSNNLNPETSKKVITYTIKF